MTWYEEQSPEWTRYLAVDADLDIEVDTAAGEHVTGRLTGHGHRLRLEFDRPELLAETTDRSTLTAVAAQLVRAQLRAELHGPRGRIAVVDPAHTSRVAALLTGSPHISVDRSGVGTRGPNDGPRDLRSRSRRGWSRSL